MAISPSAVGYQAHLEDDKSACEIYVDRDLSRWEAPGRTRRIALITANATPQTDPTTAADNNNGLPALHLEVQGAWVSPFIPACESWYDAGSGCTVASIYYDFSGDSNTAFNLVAFSANTDDTIDEGSGDLYSASTGTGTYTPALARRYLGLSWQYTATPAGADGAIFYVDVRHLAAFGGHGLTKRGMAPDQGVYDGDVIGHALSRWCPQLAYTDETLVADTFVIPQLAFREPTTVGEIIKQATRFNLRDWAVWEGPLFWLHDRGARGNRWRAPVGPAQLEETGPQVDRLWNSIIVQHQDVDGSTRTVGPTGSGADTESAFLLDDDPENPANKAGITRRDLLTMGVSTPEGAIEVGRRFLEQTKALDSSGRARIVGHVQDDKGVWHPYSHVRAGDMISFTDAADTSERRIVKTDKGRSDRTCSIDLDAPPEALQALLERLGVVLVPLGL